MANTKSAEKRARQTKVRTARNKSIKSRVRNARKAALTAIQAGDQAVIAAKVAEFSSAADKAANKNVIHKNAADRLKSRLVAAVSKGAVVAAK